MPVKGLIEGRRVHYVLDGGETEGDHRAADVVKVTDNDLGTCNLLVLFDVDDTLPHHGYFSGFYEGVPYSENKEIGTWHFIEYQE